jgi:hypothetical protein
MRNKEEIEFSINAFWLLYKALIDIGSLRWIVDISSLLLKESLSYSFVDNDQGNVRRLILFQFKFVLFSNNLIKLLELKFNYLFSHWITDTVSVDENLVGHGIIIVFSVNSECTGEVLLEYRAWDNFLALLVLRAWLGIVLA